MDKPGYPIFPWSSSPQKAKSRPTVLKYHWATGLLLMIVVCWNIEECLLDDKMAMLWVWMHYIFVLGIIPNLFFFGDAPTWVGFMVNTIELTILQWSLINNQITVYFWALVAPVILETMTLTFYIVKWRLCD